MTRLRPMLVTALLPLAVLAGCSGSESATTSPSPDPNVTPSVAPMCAEDDPDCEDMVEVPSADPDDGGAAGACLEDATECADFPTGGPPPPEVGALVEPRDDLVDVAATPWESVAPVDDEQTTLAVAWTGGNETCFGLDRVEVEETDDAVTLTVYTGRVDGIEVCTMEAVLTTTEVVLAEPLGPRSILDGAG